MNMSLGRLTNSLMRVAAVLIAASALSACSSVPDWADPTSWIGGNDTAASTDTSANTADNGQYPDLANMPQKPAAPSTPDAQKQVADSLVAARSQNQYAADQLRAGTEAAAPPPPPPSATPQVASVDTGQSAAPDDSGDQDQDNGGGAATADNTAPSTPAPPSPAPTGPATQVASLSPPASATPPGAEPAVPAVPDTGSAIVPGMQMPQPSDAQLGFQPSTAPPLNASVAQFVSPAIINRFRQTSTVTSNPAVEPAPEGSAPAVALNMPEGARPPVQQSTTAGEGGPEEMSGDVVANFDALQSSANPTSVYASASGLPPVEVVMFPNDTTVLSAEGKQKVREAYAAFAANGGRGYIRVVGHSSSRTANMPLARHLMLNFEKSQARANAVARALIALGVPAKKVLVEAVGDSQPVYYESMPEGEEGNRRAEIFLQG